ncbi:MAG: DEAD/DEAH box helicase, partial [Desulfarculus sp.]|nr:DEAD/DEAH box helicase [Desulfarculus sp.]
MPEAAPFVPDPFQVQAVELLAGHDVVVSAPTGSGKTWIAEQAIRAALDQGQRAWYASPLRALSNSKYAEFGELFGT